MLFRTLSAAVYGIDANLIDVEVDVGEHRSAAAQRIYSNEQMGPRQIRTYCELSSDLRTPAGARHRAAGIQRSRSRSDFESRPNDSGSGRHSRDPVQAHR